MIESKFLVSRIVSGDSHAASQFVEMYRERIFKITFSFLNDTQDAEDVTQDVFIEVLQNLKLFRGESSLGTWIYRIAVNKSLNFIRSKKKYKFWKHLDEMLSFSSVTANEPYSTDNRLDTDEQRYIIKRAIDALPEKQRIAFTLNKVDELPYTEVAEIMNLSHSAIESLIHRAKMNLQKSLAAYFLK